jgi:integral membrane protein
MDKWLDDLGRLRIVGYIEGVTLISLLFVAVPLKRIFGMPELVSVLGPIHGLTFVAYLVCVINVVSSGGWLKREIFRTVIVAIIPFGTFFNDHYLASKHEELHS